MESTEVNCSENSAVQETTTTTITITSSSTVNNVTTDKTTEDHYDYDDNQTEVLTKTIHSDMSNSNDLQSSINSHETTASESKVDDHETENPQNHNKTNVITTGIMIIRNETISPHSDTFNNEVIPMNTDVSIDEIDMKQEKTHTETSQQLQENNLENNQDIKTEVELSLIKNSPDISTHKSSISNNSSINQSTEHYITTQEESLINNDKDDERNSPKHPYRPPPPKLNQTKHTSVSLSYSGGENDDVISKNDKLNDNSQIDTTTTNNNYETNVKTSIKQQQNENDVDQHKPQYKRPTIKSNIKHVFTNLRKSFKRKDKPSIKRVVNDHDNVENNHTYTSQQPMTTHAYNNNNNDYIDHRNKQSNFPSSSSSHQEYHHQYYRNSNELQENQSQLSNAQSLNISITDSLQQLKRPEEDIDIIYSTEIIAPPAIPTKMSSDPNNPIYVNHSIKPNRPPTIDRKETDPLSIQYQPNHSYTMRSERRIVSPGSLDRRYPQEYDQYYSSPEARRVQTMRYTDYPTRPRVYQPTYQAATMSFNEFDHHYNNGGTIKPRKPKIITERYKCSEVYNWPPKFPKLKRHKTNPPKQIHTAQDHIVIKQQLKTTAGNNYSPTVQQKEPNTEQIHCTKINNQYQSPNYKREISVSPERQVTSLHSLQRSTLLEKSNRTPGTETRDQLFIADYKLTPNNQIGSTKPDALALPYFAKMTENKRFSKFHYNTTTSTTTNNNNNNNNIAMSAEVMRSDSPKSLASLIDALKTIHPLLHNLNENHIPSSLTNHDNNENSKLFIHCLSEYLFTCMKLRSLDLKGEFVTFLFPLKHFNEQLWNKYGTIDDWNELSVVCEPNTNYEYVVLNTANESSQKIRFPKKTIDKLLTNWLDNQTTKTPSPGNRHSLESKNNTEKHSDDKLLHSISLAVTLKTLLNLFEKHEKVESDEHHPHQEQQQQQPQPCVDLFLTCIKLNVLLSLSECLDKNKSIQFNLKPEHILLILTPSNCLTIFKHYEKIQNNKQNEKPANTDDDNHNETHDLQSLLKIMNIQYDSMNESINDLIKQLYEIIQHKYQYSDMITSLLKSVAPPDWITMCVARICLYNQTNS
ncbi:unnamed protein product [Schistosoma bovis]|nr:unnamed protein product [Schistosoma bovis]